MKNEIITCITNSHLLYADNFRRNNIRVGKSYKCIEELLLTSEVHHKAEFSSLKGVTIKSHVDRYGWARPCLPKECFRLATKTEIDRYKRRIMLNAPFAFFKISFFKILREIDFVVRGKYYQKLYEEYGL